MQRERGLRYERKRLPVSDMVRGATLCYVEFPAFFDQASTR
jgi:hypothetical protein